RVALALVAVMLSLAGVYALLGVHVIAVFQVLIYVGAAMVFIVYAIMLLGVPGAGYRRPARVPGNRRARHLARLAGTVGRRSRNALQPERVLAGFPERLL